MKQLCVVTSEETKFFSVMSYWFLLPSSLPTHTLTSGLNEGIYLIQCMVSCTYVQEHTSTFGRTSTLAYLRNVSDVPGGSVFNNADPSMMTAPASGLVFLSRERMAGRFTIRCSCQDI